MPIDQTMMQSPCLMRKEGETFGEEMIVRGTLERLAPVLMTALAGALGLLPLALSVGQPGKELLQPIAVVILGGLLSSTLLDQLVTPAIFHRVGNSEFGAKIASPVVPVKVE